MNRIRTWFVGILLGGAVLGAMCGSVWAENFQPNWQPADGGTASPDWQQRVLRQPQPQPISVAQRPASPRPQSAGSYRTAQGSSGDAARFSAAPGSAEPEATGQPHGTGIVRGREIIEPGTVQFDPLASEGVFADNGSGRYGGGPAGECDTCGTACGPAGDDCCDFGWECFDGRCGPWIRGLSISAGVHGFKNVLDRGQNGNFGFQEGVNFAGPLGDPWGCGFQVGANFVQSDFSGARDNSVTVGPNTYNLRAPDRKQTFFTVGIFQRAMCGGLQWGVAYDHLHDEYYGVTTTNATGATGRGVDLQQVRSETAYVIDNCYEIGYYGVYGVGTARVIDGKLDPTDMFCVFLRRTFETGGNGRVWGGVTGYGDGLIGADLWVPLGCGWALENRVNYLIPASHTADSTQVRESWGLLAQLVWYPGRNALCQRKNPYRPIFNVADNSLFMVDRLINQTAP